MKYVWLLLCLTALTPGFSQGLKPTSLSISYFGETITHPGLKLAATYSLDTWQKTKTRKGGEEKLILSSIGVGPSLGFFYHKDYQTGIFIVPELSYTRTKANGNFVKYGIGAGYMRTFVPNVYDSNPDGEIETMHEGYNYFLSNYFIAFGKDLSVANEIPMDIFIKPQFMYALPNTSHGVWYFALEIGVSYRFDK
jgi:hypothetical protein